MAPTSPSSSSSHSNLQVDNATLAPDAPDHPSSPDSPGSVETELTELINEINKSRSVMASNDMTGLEGIGKAPDDVVLPPKEIRRVIEVVAGYIARNGPAFEDRTYEKNVGNPKFSFLTKTDPYRGYYEWRLSEVRAGRGTEASAGAIGTGPASREPPKPSGPKEPPEFHFSARMPNINAQDLEVVKLTAMHVAKHGRPWMMQLSQKESTNFQFHFLRPQHSLHQFFTRMVEQYTELLNTQSVEGRKGEEARIEELKHNIKDKFHILERAKQRAEWVKHQERQKKKQDDDAEAERLAYAQIDWHDFVVVETVMFDEADDEADLPPPTSLSDLQSASLEQRGAMSLAPANRRIEEAMPTDEMMYDTYSTAPQTGPSRATPQSTGSAFMAPSTLPARPPPVPAPPPPVAHQPPPPTAQLPVPAPARPSSTTPANAPMKIRSDYVPRAAAARAASNVPHAICPNCKQSVPVAELQEHIRIELLDPQWKEQRAKADSRYATTNLSTAEVAKNLKRLASQRTDVFDEGVFRAGGSGGVDGAYANIAASEAEREQKRMNVGIGPDGSMQGHPVNIEEQLRRIQEKAAGGRG